MASRANSALCFPLGDSHSSRQRADTPRTLLDALPPFQPVRYSGEHENREIGPWRRKRSRQQVRMSHGGSNIRSVAHGPDRGTHVCTDPRAAHHPSVPLPSTKAPVLPARRGEGPALSCGCRSTAARARMEGGLPASCAPRQFMNTRFEPERRPACTVR